MESNYLNSHVFEATWDHKKWYPCCILGKNRTYDDTYESSRGVMIDCEALKPDKMNKIWVATLPISHFRKQILGGTCEYRPTEQPDRRRLKRSTSARIKGRAEVLAELARVEDVNRAKEEERTRLEQLQSLQKECRVQRQLELDKKRRLNELAVKAEQEHAKRQKKEHEKAIAKHKELAIAKRQKKEHEKAIAKHKELALEQKKLALEQKKLEVEKMKLRERGERKKREEKLREKADELEREKERKRAQEKLAAQLKVDQRTKKREALKLTFREKAACAHVILQKVYAMFPFDAKAVITKAASFETLCKELAALDLHLTSMLIDLSVKHTSHSNVLKTIRSAWEIDEMILCQARLATLEKQFCAQGFVHCQTCTLCRENAGSHEMIRCAGCIFFFHLECAGLISTSTVTQGRWRCSLCTQSAKLQYCVSTGDMAGVASMLKGAGCASPFWKARATNGFEDATGFFDKNGLNAIEIACAAGNVEMLQMLLSPYISSRYAPTKHEVCAVEPAFSGPLDDEKWESCTLLSVRDGKCSVKIDSDEAIVENVDEKYVREAERHCLPRNLFFEETAATNGNVECFLQMMQRCTAECSPLASVIQIRRNAPVSQDLDFSVGLETSQICWASKTVKDEYFRRYPDVVFIRKNVEHRSVKIKWMSLPRGGCKKVKAKCDPILLESGGSSAMKSVPIVHCQENGSFSACNYLCPCAKFKCNYQNLSKSCYIDCGRRPFSTGVRFRLVIDKCKSRGYGVFAGEFIPRGEFLCEYVGELISTRENRRREINRAETKFQGDYTWEMPKQKFFIDATKFRNVGAFINHACRGNNVTPKFCFSNQSVQRLGFWANRDIMEGEEITTRYFTGTFLRSNSEWKKHCQCAYCEGKRVVGSVITPRTKTMSSAPYTRQRSAPYTRQRSAPYTSSCDENEKSKTTAASTSNESTRVSLKSTETEHVMVDTKMEDSPKTLLQKQEENHEKQIHQLRIEHSQKLKDMSFQKDCAIAKVKQSMAREQEKFKHELEKTRVEERSNMQQENESLRLEHERKLGEMQEAIEKRHRIELENIQRLHEKNIQKAKYLKQKKTLEGQTSRNNLQTQELIKKYKPEIEYKHQQPRSVEENVSCIVVVRGPSARIELAQGGSILEPPVFVRWLQPPSPEMSEIVSGRLESGSVLIRVGNVNVHGKSLDSIGDIIRSSNRPVHLYFSEGLSMHSYVCRE